MKSNNIVMVGFFMFICLVALGYTNYGIASNGWKLIFEENIESGLRNWKSHGNEIAVVEEGGGKRLKIARKDSREFTYIARDFTNYSGSLKLEALIKADSVVQGAASYDTGKFQAVVIERGKEISWPNDDFIGTFEPTFKSFEVLDIKSSDIVKLRIGLQNTKGTIYVGRVKVFYKP